MVTHSAFNVSYASSSPTAVSFFWCNLLITLRALIFINFLMNIHINNIHIKYTYKIYIDRCKMEWNVITKHGSLTKVFQPKLVSENIMNITITSTLIQLVNMVSENWSKDFYNRDR